MAVFWVLNGLSPLPFQDRSRVPTTTSRIAITPPEGRASPVMRGELIIKKSGESDMKQETIDISPVSKAFIFIHSARASVIALRVTRTRNVEPKEKSS